MRSVLIVEDDRDLRNSLSECLSLAGYSVTVAADAVDGFGKLCSVQPQLVLLDQRVPSFAHGREFLQKKAADPKAASIPVILISGYSGFPNVDGIVAFLQKPFDLDVVLALAEKYAGRGG